MSAINEEELRLIHQFRDNLKDVLVTEEELSDYFLIRWIRAREGNLSKAEVMLREALEWRKVNEMDNILEKKVDPFFPQTFPYWIECIDKIGRPVIEMPIGRWDVRKALGTSEMEQSFVQYINRLFEITLSKIRNCEKKKGELPVTQVIAIWNWKGYSYGQFLNRKAVGNVIRTASLYEAYYPEILYKLICINCPSFFPLLFAMAKPFMAPATVEKIQVFGSNREEWEPIVRDLVQSNQIGIEFGGSDFQRFTTND